MARVILKFFLTFEAGTARTLLERLDEPSKNWKFSMGDITERALWTRYMAVYQDIVRAHLDGAAPWHVVPRTINGSRAWGSAPPSVGALEKLDLKFRGPTRRR